MNEIRRVVRIASWRLVLIDAFRILAVALTVGVTLVFLARLTERVFGLASTFDPLWSRIFIYTGAAVVLATVAAALIRRRRTLSVAQELDERAGLKEALSTALYIEKDQDPWSRNVVETASRLATGVKVSRAIPLAAPRLWPVPLASALALTLAWFTLPNFDVLKVTEKKVVETRKQHEIQAVKAEIDANAAKLKEMLAKAKVNEFVEEPTPEGAEGEKPLENDPDALRRAAVKQLTSLTDRLEAEKEGEKAAQAEALKEAMKQLKTPGQGPLNEFSRSLARGDFNKAQEELTQLSKQLAEGNMSPEEADAAKKQLENMAKQLDKLGSDKEALAKKLEQQGLDKKTAQELAQKAASADPEALKKAMEQAKNLTEEQKKQLMEMAKSACKSMSQCKNMGEAMSKMAAGMQQQGLQQDGMEGMEQLAAELSEAELLESDMQNLDAALDEAKKQLAQLAGDCMGGDCPGGDGPGGNKPGKGQGAWREGDSSAMGSGSGGPGKGNGASPESEAVDYTTEKVKANTQTTQGPIIGSRLVYGEQVKGESRAQFEAVVEASEKEAAEALDTMQIPREYHDAVKHYFGTLQDKVKKDKPAAPAPAAGPK